MGDDRGVDPDAVAALLDASDGELLSLLGAYSLPLVAGPQETLAAGRSGELWQRGSLPLGDKQPFVHEGLAKFGREFLRKWKKELRSAICENKTVYKNLKKKENKGIDLAIGVLVGALTTHIPQLAAIAGLLTVLVALILRTGVEAFCSSLG